jgi:hypothetical protein
MASMGKNFTKEQNTVCVLLFLSFVLGIIAIYFNKVDGIIVGGRTAVYIAIALVPATLIYLRDIYRPLSAVLLANLSGLTIGSGIGFLGKWYVLQNPSKFWLARNGS